MTMLGDASIRGVPPLGLPERRSLFVLALSGAVLAQDLSPKVRANISFNFYAGSKELPVSL
jgi:hypothetical protein